MFYHSWLKLDLYAAAWKRRPADIVGCGPLNPTYAKLIHRLRRMLFVILFVPRRLSAPMGLPSMPAISGPVRLSYARAPLVGSWALSRTS